MGESGARTFSTRPTTQPERTRSWRPLATRWIETTETRIQYRQSHTQIHTTPETPPMSNPDIAPRKPRRRQRKHKKLNPEAPAFQTGTSLGSQSTAPLPGGGISLTGPRTDPTSESSRFNILSFTPVNQPTPDQFSGKQEKNSDPSRFPSPSSSTPPAVKDPVAPVARKSYIAKASLSSELVELRRPLLVILDLNGTLIYRTRRGMPPKFVERPGLRSFLTKLFANYTVMIWSSARPQTVDGVLKKILRQDMRRKLIGVWARDTLGLTKAQFNEKVQVYKRLERVWEDRNIQATHPEYRLNKQQKSADGSGGWDQTNTVLIDDSKLKAVGQPHNIIEISEFTNDASIDEETNMTNVLRQLEILSRQRDVSQKIREWEANKVARVPAQYLAFQHPNSAAEIQLFWKSQLAMDEKAVEQLNQSATTINHNENKNNSTCTPQEEKVGDIGIGVVNLLDDQNLTSKPSNNSRATKQQLNSDGSESIGRRSRSKRKVSAKKKGQS